MRSSGFGVLELVVAAATGVLLTGGLLALLSVQARAVEREAGNAELRQALHAAAEELARHLRSAGRGGAPASVDVRDDVPVGSRVAGPGSALVVPATDVLIVRAAFDQPIYEIQPLSAVLESGSVGLRRATSGGSEQDLDRLARRAAEEVGGALVLSGLPGAEGCAVVELTGHSIVGTGPGGEVEELAVLYRSRGSELADAYGAFCDATPETATRLAWLQERRFFVRSDPEGFEGTPRHRLSRLRVRPGTDLPEPGASDAGEDLVDHALDLQVVLGIDLNGDGTLEEGVAGEDEWLGNEPEDDADDPIWNVAPATRVRVTLMLRGARREAGWLDPPIERIENRLYREGSTPAGDAVERRYRRSRLRLEIRSRG